MDLLKTILLYMTMTFVSSVQVAPDPATVSDLLNPTPTPTAIILSTAAPTATPAPTPSPTPVPTPAITPNKAYKTLRVGDKGDEVKKLQARLAELGYYTGDVDGRFGNQTRRAVEHFQYYQGLQVDGIAGRASLTVLYESDDVVAAPVETTPAPSVQVTNGPTVAVTEQSETPAPTFVPTDAPTTAAATEEPTQATDEPTQAPDASPYPTAVVLSNAGTVEPTGEATPEPTAETTVEPTSEATIEPTAEPTIEPTLDPAATPTPMADYAFRLEGATEPMTRPDTEGEPLRPLKLGEDVYVPFIAILQDAGVVTIPGTSGERDEVAFAMLEDVYRLSYVQDNAGNVTAIEFYKNEKPQVMTLRKAYAVDGLLYLPVNVTMELTGVGYTLDEATLTYIVALPKQPEG